MNSHGNLKVGLPICAYTAFIILSCAETNISNFNIYVSALIFIAAVVMAINIMKLSPADYRTKCALWELGYCIVIYGFMKILDSIIGNICSGMIVIICCIIYLRYINPKFMHRYILPTNM